MIGQSLQIQAAVATLAALNNTPDAVARGDEVAQRLLEDGLWSVTGWAAYQGRPAEERRAYWASGQLVMSLDYQPSVKQLVKDAYESNFGFLLPGSSGYTWWKAWDEGGFGSQLPTFPDLGLGTLVKLLSAGAGVWLAITLYKASRE